MNQSRNTVGQRKHIEPVPDRLPDPRIGWFGMVRLVFGWRGERRRGKTVQTFFGSGKKTNKQTKKLKKKPEYCRTQKQARTLLDTVSLYRGKIHSTK